jgi:hypothetical protein
MYKLGTLKLPKLIKKYRSGKVIEQQAIFDEMSVRDKRDVPRIINMTPQWDTYTPELSYWDEEMVPILPIRDYDDFLLDELP